ncbi:uncharacterized protein STEHIDRAFT_140792 [Stereum hirsutum FP-91666 SS1]|uniref:uncharacterized protein n=1 Tax=Stereum hirsutum (strain FP-91666) TaxID=721885 RepID=UPI0004449383|nr:uncharacterized protein STEHIDRAFT_140792 [Stereum hirsutum FP-91666 SS1]EIM83707.1 hypothetical protein STEHIDRAFT_140792 [Stereum hirsutum FP-91666 SS1]
MSGSTLLQRVNSAVKLRGEEGKHEKTNAWSNRDLIPLPPARRTWGFFEFFGFWTLGSLNVATWQTPNTFLTAGLSVGQALGVIIVGRAIIGLFATLVAWCGLKYHIGYTVQNRYSWGMRASYIPLLQRILLNFIWNASQAWTGGKLVAVCITAIFPSFANLPDSLPASFPASSRDMVGFFIFWLFSLPFLWVPPEKFRRPFQVTSIYCGLGMVCMLIWSLSVARGVGPIFYRANTLSSSSSSSSSSSWSTAWIMLKCINSTIGGKAAGMTNGSDFSRYGKRKRDFILGTFTCLFCVGTLVSFVGLVVTAAGEKIYGTVYWNPPDLLMRMMSDGGGSGKARAGVFFLALGFALTSGFENICGNAVAGGIDLAGLFPRYISIRRGALITFFAAWIVQPWQLVNKATTFLTVISSFSVFLAPIMGIMCADFFVLRKQKVRLSDLYRAPGEGRMDGTGMPVEVVRGKAGGEGGGGGEGQGQEHDYWFWHGVNWRVFPAWLAGWAPTIGGLVATAKPIGDAARPVFELYYISFFLGFFISFILFYTLNVLFPPPGLGASDDTDIFGAFSRAECRKLGIAPNPDSAPESSEGGSEGSDVESLEGEKVPVTVREGVVGVPVVEKS